MRAVDDLELRVAPICALGSLVLAEADHRRLFPQRFRRAVRVEVELDHLPVAFVLVVEVVEEVEEPVLECELSGVRRVRDDARIRMRPVSLVDAM
ncbi:MAG TPA: hypothetical protein VIZ44_01460 [Gaiellaceae bacterium]